MAQIRFANNVSTQLTKPVAADDSTIEVRSLSQGLVWPDISTTGDYFLIVIDDISAATWEILKCTKVEINDTTTTLTVERGIEGTTPSRFNAGSVVENRLTAGTLDMFSEEFPAVVEIDRGGTGATTAKEARTNLEVPSKTEVDNDISSLDTKLTNAVNTKAPIYHADTVNTYGLGTDSLYGHVKGDGITTNISEGTVLVRDIALRGDKADLVSNRGIFTTKGMSALDYNTLTEQGIYAVPNAGSTNGPGYAAKVLVYAVYGSSLVTQIAIDTGTANIKWRFRDQFDAWSEWFTIISNKKVATASSLGVIKSGDGLKIDSAGTLNVDDTIVRTSGNQTITGQKTFLNEVHVKGSTYPYNIQWPNVDNSSTPSTDKYYGMIRGVDKSEDTATILRYIDAKDGKKLTEILVYKNVDGELVQSSFRVCIGPDNVPFVSIPTPPDTSNTNTATTTAWVKRYAPIASASKAGLVKPGTGTSVAGDGALSVDTASTSKKGIVQLSSSVSSTSETTAATSKAVKTAYDKADAALPKADTDTTAAAGKVPVANSSGKLDNSWLPTPVTAKAYVTQTWKSGDGSSWYRVWSDGLIEQKLTITAKNTTVSVTLLKNYSTTKYSVIIPPAVDVDQTKTHIVKNKTTSSFSLLANNAGNGYSQEILIVGY